MALSEWYYLPVAALINSFFTIYWQKIMSQQKGISKNILLIVFLGSLFTALGLDVLQRLLDIDSLIQALKISLGCWLMFAVATGAKHYAVNGWSKKNFWIDYGGDLIGFMMMGLIIYALT